MARAYGTYSRLIAWLKVLLPLVALALLSTIFLLSNRGEQNGPLPIGGDASGEALQEGVSGPYFAGTTENGDAITMTAIAARPQSDGQLLADRVDANLRLSDGGVITLRSDNARLSDATQSVELMGGVEIASSTGYRITTDQLRTSLDVIAAETAGPVSGVGPVGTFSAGKMTISPIGDSDDIQLLFTGGIKLVYDPQ